jgi:hypothetical protein
MAESATLKAGKKPLAVVYLYKIDDVAEAQPVDQVAERAADDQRERQGRAPVRARRLASQRTSTALTPTAKRREQPALPAFLVGKETECRAGVEASGPVEQAGDHDVRDLRFECAEDDALVI